MNILNQFEKIISLVGENGLNEAFFETAKEFIEPVSKLLHTTPTQTVLFALILEHFGENSVSLKAIAETLKCGKMQLLGYMDEFDALRQKRLIRPKKADVYLSSDSSSACSFPEYTVPIDVINAVRKGVEYKCTRYNNLSPEEFFDCADRLLNSAVNDDMDTETLVNELNFVLSVNKNLTFAKKKKEYGIGDGSMIIMLLFCCALIEDDTDSWGAEKFLVFIRKTCGIGNARDMQRRFKSGEHKLFQKGLVEYDCQDGVADAGRYRLTQKAKDEFLSDIDLKKNTNRSGKDFILHKNLSGKKLFYSEKMKNRINELTELLRENNFSGVQKRLEESGMRTGFACIFSGPPGTGKTETVYQIARKTGRDIMLVDVSETKSKWFGDSEKRIKALFDRYRSIVNNGGLAPILLFNEADAVLGKRRELSEFRSGPDQTENAVQNIILQEMENLNGILIATTNMTVNLDKAFERRFLYKIEFEKPDAESKKLMWQSFIPDLSDEEAADLSCKFDFSGGQIENIARKSTVSFILNGTTPDFGDFVSLCGEEVLEKPAVRIGFRA